MKKVKFKEASLNIRSGDITNSAPSPTPTNFKLVNSHQPFSLVKGGWREEGDSEF